MAYLGTPPRSRVLSSADIGTGAVTLDDISFTDQPTSVNVSGDINKHTMRLADQVVIDGDLDITDNLILSKISDDGNAITLTNDSSTRTITGTGSLEASTLTQTPNASLTGMTGTIGSGVNFPSGHTLQCKILTDEEDLSTESEVTSTGSIAINCTAGNILLIWLNGGFTYNAYASGEVTAGIDINGTKYWGSRYSSNNAIVGSVATVFVSYSVPSTTTYTIKRAVKRSSGTGSARWSTESDNSTVFWAVMEIQG